MRWALFIAVAASAAAQTQVDWVKQVKNKPSVDVRRYKTSTSLSGGLKETIQAVSSGATISIASNTTIREAISINKSISLECAKGVTLTASGISGAMLTVAANSVSVRNCTLNGGGVATSLIKSAGGYNDIIIEGNVLTNSAMEAVWINGGQRINVHSNIVYGNKNFGINIGGPNVDPLAYVSIIGNQVDDTGCTAEFCGGIATWAVSDVTIANNLIRAGGNKSQAIVWLREPTSRGHGGAITGNVITFTGTSAFEGIGIAGVDHYTISGNVIDATGIVSANVLAIEVNQSDNGVVSGNHIFGNGSSPMTGIAVESSSGVVVNANTVKGWGAASSNGITLITNVATTPMSNNSVTNNNLITTSGTATTGAIRIETLFPVVVANNVIAGNQIKGNTTSGHNCIWITNSAAGTISGHSVIGNVVDSCDVGVSIFSGGTTTVANNVMTNTTTKIVDFGTATRVIDNNGLPFSFLSSHANGSLLFCSDCNSTCTAGSSTGQFCKRINGAWTN